MFPISTAQSLNDGRDEAGGQHLSPRFRGGRRDRKCCGQADARRCYIDNPVPIRRSATNKLSSAAGFSCGSLRLSPVAALNTTVWGVLQFQRRFPAGRIKITIDSSAAAAIPRSGGLCSSAGQASAIWRCTPILPAEARSRGSRSPVDRGFAAASTASRADLARGLISFFQRSSGPQARQHRRGLGLFQSSPREGHQLPARIPGRRCAKQ